MIIKKKKPFSGVKKSLKKLDIYWTKPILTRSAVVLAISVGAAIVDGLSINYTLSPIIKGLGIMCPLLTLAFAVVLDILPNYFTLGFLRIRNLENQEDKKQAKFVKSGLFVAGIIWLVSFASLCAVRAALSPVILKEVIREFAVDKKSDFVVTPWIQQLLMLFLDVVNLGTSGFVLIANIVSFKSLSEYMQAKEITTEVEFEKGEKELERKANELEPIAAMTDEEIENRTKQTIEDAAAEAATQAVGEKVFSREVLERKEADGDVDIKITADSVKVVHSEQGIPDTQTPPVDSDSTITTIVENKDIA